MVERRIHVSQNTQEKARKNIKLKTEGKPRKMNGYL